VIFTRHHILQSEYVEAGHLRGQLAGPVLNFEVHHGDALYDFNARETRTVLGADRSR